MATLNQIIDDALTGCELSADQRGTIVESVTLMSRMFGCRPDEEVDEEVAVREMLAQHIPPPVFASLIGLTADEAEQIAKEAGFGFRVTFIPGETVFTTDDVRPNRINAGLDEDRKVARFYNFG